MKLISFSVENYRSITTARKIPLSNYSLLVGPNNEGKSNILHALALAMNALVEWKRHFRHTPSGRLLRIQPSVVRRLHRSSRYDWDTDFPVSKQKKTSLKDSTNITLEFEFNPDEIEEFKSEIKSNLNGTLPLMVSFSQRQIDVSVRKQGPGQDSLTRETAQIAEFISKRIRFEYIPAIRTADSAKEVIYQLVDRELSQLENDEEYKEALAKIEKLQQPVLVELAETIQQTVSNFLPNVKSVELNTDYEERYRTLRRSLEIAIDDGHQTKLEHKGDGVQSLVALALMRYASEHSSSSLSTVIAIEEPESHLHPDAIHQLRSVIENLSLKNQVVLTSHSPLFINPNNLNNTIIVKDRKAVCAKRISEVRNALGVRFSDNLHNAEMVLLFEGPNDALVMRQIIAARSKTLKNALHSRTVAIDYLGGASSLLLKVSFYQSAACLVQCFIDDDEDGRKAMKKATENKVLGLADINLCKVSHLEEAELEDIYDKEVYSPSFVEKFRVDPRKKLRSKSKKKWSSAMKELFLKAGKPWNDEVKREVKNWLAHFAASHAETILKEELCGPLQNFIDTVEERLPDKQTTTRF